jgi:hypothetical protein
MVNKHGTGPRFRDLTSAAPAPIGPWNGPAQPTATGIGPVHRSHPAVLHLPARRGTRDEGHFRSTIPSSHAVDLRTAFFSGQRGKLGQSGDRMVCL